MSFVSFVFRLFSLSSLLSFVSFLLRLFSLSSFLSFVSLKDVDCDDDDESVSDVSGDERVSDDSGNERVEGDAESDIASENDDIADIGFFVLPSSSSWKRIICVMT